MKGLALPRLRVFAGPNGSGKSTIRELLREEWIGVYVNADEIEKVLQRERAIDLADFALTDATAGLQRRLHGFLHVSALWRRAGLAGAVEELQIDGWKLALGAVPVNSYVAAVLADFIRRELLAAGLSFTFETVMSSPDKVDFMRQAQAQGFRTYLYFVATADPEINVARVRQRVAEGGHDVPSDKIVQRYGRSIGLLGQACDAANRAYIFDNSGDQHVLIAETTDGETMTLHADAVPQWLTATSLWQSFQPDRSDA
ncbi:zeta toxin family protein [Azohydromonas australica]|uniref:zeta toxin family protein n=1 Tax=Azohydromonas australica TaxID=364039 RepID=UPI0003F5E9D5|nr:zeta toxin family protein [Azohydromonas australica]